jgi:hypothetical protein
MKYFLTTCCKQKRQNQGLLPARERYTSPRVQLVCAEAERMDIPLLIFSGKYGILEADDPIPWYDKVLTEDQVSEMVTNVTRQLNDLETTSLRIFGRSRDRESWQPYYAVLDAACLNLGIEVEFQTVDYD